MGRISGKDSSGTLVTLGNYQVDAKGVIAYDTSAATNPDAILFESNGKLTLIPTNAAAPLPAHLGVIAEIKLGTETPGGATGAIDAIDATNIADIIKNKTFAIHDATPDQSVPVTAADGTTFSGTTLADVKIGGRDIAAINADIAGVKLTDLPPGAKAVIGTDGKIDILKDDGTPFYNDIDVSKATTDNPLGGTPADGWQLKKEGDTWTIEATDAGAATGAIDAIDATNIADIIKNKTFAIHDATPDQSVPVTAADGTTFSGTTLADVKIGGRDIAAINADIAGIKLTDLPPEGAKAVIGTDGKIDILKDDGTPLYNDIDVSKATTDNPLGGTPADGWQLKKEGDTWTIEATDAGAATGPIDAIDATNIAEIIKNKTFAIHDATTDQAVPVTAADGTTFSGTTLADVKIGGRDIAALNNNAQIKLTDLPPGAKAVIGIDGKIDILGSDGTPLYDDIDVSAKTDTNPLGGTPADGWRTQKRR